jgi:colicin import membrane protein
MTSAALGHDAFAPAPHSGWGAALLLALVAHAGLVFALAASVNWSAPPTPPLEAELWSVVPVAAAPAPVEPTPPPQAEPDHPQPSAKPDAEPAQEADIRTETASERRTRLARERKERQLEKEKAKAKAKDEKRKETDSKLASKTSDKKREKELERERAQKEDERLEAILAAQREATLKRSVSMAQGSTVSTTPGTATVSSGPSANYPGRIKAHIKRNIVLTETIAGNPVAEIEIRLAPDGYIIGMKIARPSGSAEWDAAALRAIERTERLPADTDGRVPPMMVLSLRPRE